MEIFILLTFQQVTCHHQQNDLNHEMINYDKDQQKNFAKMNSGLVMMVLESEVEFLSFDVKFAVGDYCTFLKYASYN